MRVSVQYYLGVGKIGLVLATCYECVGQVSAACVYDSGLGHDISVVCDDTLPNPYTVPIQFNAPTTANILIQPDAQTLITNGGNGVLISGNSTVINNGTVTMDINDELFFDAISSRGSSNTIINNGIITTTGLLSEGIYTNGNNTSILNTGTIKTNSNSSDAIISERGSNTNLITNQGNITTQGDNSSGIAVFGNNHQALNSNLITTIGVNSYGLEIDGINSILNNSGTIITQGAQADGIEGIGSQHHLINSGSIETHGDNASGIFSYGEQNQLINNSKITTNGRSANGIYVNGDNLQVINNGTITEKGNEAYGIYSIGSDTQTLGSITNNGIIQTQGNGGAGVFMSGLTTLTNSATGVINSVGGQGVNFAAGGNVNNSGNIISNTATGILLNGDGQITNNVTGNVQGINAIFNNGGTTIINNQGTMLGLDGTAINLPGTFDTIITNSGTIRGSGSEAIVTGAGNDQLIMNNGDIAGNIIANNGNDSVALSGGEVGGEIHMGSGKDTLLWQGSGRTHGAILMGEGDDQVTLSNLTVGNTSPPPTINGGLGNDHLTVNNARFDDPSRLTQWEAVRLINQSQLHMTNSLILGDSQSQTGTLEISNSSLLAGNSGTVTIQAQNPTSPVNVTNAGVINLTNGGNNTHDSLIIAGNYIGQNGLLKLQTELNNERSPSDKLVISRGSASGTTQIHLSNVNGTGALTAGNGIELVSAINGSTTENRAFSLVGGSIAAGAYEYVLFRGGVSEGSENNWYLRNSLVPPPTTQPAQPSVPVILQSQPAPGSPELPTVTPGSPSIPLYRQETPLYSVLPPLAMELGLAQLGTYHQRQGSQTLSVSEDSTSSWGRFLGIHTQHSWSGDTGSSFDGNVTGVQVGQDFYSHQMENGGKQQLGLFYGYTDIDGDVNGSVLGFPNANAGNVKTTGNSLGGYWTYTGRSEAYLDTVLMYTWLSGSTHSLRGMNTDYSSRLLSGSVEAGIPFRLTEHWNIEPQVHFIVQHLSANNSKDAVSDIRYSSETVYTGRVGGRLTGDYVVSYGVIQPYLKVNLWHDFQHSGQVSLGNNPINQGYESTTLDVGGGVVATLNNGAKWYAVLSQNSNLDGQQIEEYSGNLGVKINW